MKMFLKYGISLLVLVLLYSLAFYFANNIAINKALSIASESEVITSNLGKIFMDIIGLIIISLVVKFLLGTRPFINAIKEIFIEIFSHHSFLKTCNDSELLSYANNITLANKNINFKDSIKDKLATDLRLKEFNKNSKEKNFIILESTYSTTILASSIEILHRKIKCKVITPGELSFNYMFLPFNKDAKLEDYKREDNNYGERFNSTAYKEILSSSDNEGAYPIKSEKSIIEKDDGNWIKINFSKKDTKKDEIIDIEFSISSFIDINNLEKLEEHYETNYSTPHAIRHFTFQIETYIEDDANVLSSLSPKIFIGSVNDNNYTFNESIYYKTYSWSFYYHEHKNEPICVKVK